MGSVAAWATDAVLVPVPPPQRTPACTLALQGAGVVIEVIDGATLKLSDGQVVRLAGVLTPSAPLAADQNSEWAPARDAKSALQKLVSGSASIEFAVADQKARTDRHGRTVAHVVATANGQSIWLQGALLRSGHARVTSMMSGWLCLNEMLTEESTARRAQLGLWANAAYQPIDTSNTQALKFQRTSFALAEGKILSVTERAERTYLNFGHDWRWDFTVSVSKAVRARNASAAQKLATLSGQRVRVRGWLDQRNGPLIEIGDLSEIEVVE